MHMHMTDSTAVCTGDPRQYFNKTKKKRNYIYKGLA